METNIGRTFAALSATNEAILYAKSPEELYRQVCEAAFSNGDFLATAVFLLEPETRMLRFATGFGGDVKRLREIEISSLADRPEGRGVCGRAFRDQKISISNDYRNEAHSLAWRQGVCEAHIGAAAALPLTCNGRSVGVLLVTLHEAGSLNDPIISLLQRMSANISHALDNFDREAARKDGERAMRRLNRMFGALSATNEAILRARSEPELYQLVCDAAVHGGKSTAAVVLLAEPDSIWLKPVAGTGEIVEQLTRTRFSIDPDNIYGKGISGGAFRTQKPCINPDILNSAQARPWHELGREVGVMAGVALPLIRAGSSVGVLFFFIGKSWAVDEEIIALMARIAENVSAALDNFDRAAEKTRTDAQKERLTRMFAALGATNEAIMRAKSRPELFELVCEAAVRGAKFSSTTIALVQPNSEFLRIVATRGPNADEMKNLEFAISDRVPEGRGLSGAAFRTRQPRFSNDFLADERTRPWHDAARRAGVQSTAALPLLDGDRVEGVMIFNSLERNTFTPEFVELLQRLAENVAFALVNFDRADEKAKAEKQKERLTGMFEALSATNEAIMRVKTRAQLFDLVCQAAVLGGMFTSATIALAEPGAEFLSIAATKGRNYDRMKNRRFAISAETPEGTGLSGTSFRTRRPCIMNDFLTDLRVAFWHDMAKEDGTRSGASFPLLRQGDEAIGVLMFLSRDAGAFTDDLVELLARLAENVSFALDNFDRAEEKARTQEQKERLTRMFAALGATNEAIMRAKSRAELFALVCEAAARGGEFTSITIGMAVPDSDFLDTVAVAGPTADTTWRVRLSISESHPAGRGLTGRAFRSRQPCISNDYLADAQNSAFHAILLEDRARSGAAFPLLIGERAVGVMLFISSEKDTFNTECLDLLQRLAENVAFALGNFDRADEKAEAEKQKDRLTLMYAALSATNEAIVQAESRTQLFELVCEAAVRGAGFSSATIALLEPNSEFLRVVASSGPSAHEVRNARFGIVATTPEGCGLTGTAFRTGQPSISDDFLTDERTTPWHAGAGRTGVKSAAALPLLSGGRPMGVLFFNSTERGTFANELVELLRRLAENVSAAVANFDRADEKARSDEQKERLTRMFEALSATNEAIMRAKSRTELFDLVCEAAVVGGNFTSTAIVLERPGAEFLDNVAASGPDRERARKLQLSVDADRPEGQGITGIA
ncbi:MAG: GAF domain-containing protein, partial [Bradyrhizobium sp.]